MSICLAIPHTPWRPERVESLHRLDVGLGLRLPNGYVEKVSYWQEKEPNWSWSSRMWAWAESAGSDHFLQLQDDAMVGSRFWPHLQAMIRSVPDQIIGLESVHDWAPVAERLGQHWYKTADCLIGVGYVVPLPVLRDFNRWRADVLRPGATTGAMNEDTMIGVFCMSTGRRIWHPVPTIIDHDIELPSTYGNDKHSHRRPSVKYLGPTGPGHAWDVGDVRDVGRFYGATPSLCRRWVRGFGLDRYAAAIADRGDV